MSAPTAVMASNTAAPINVAMSVGCALSQSTDQWLCNSRTVAAGLTTAVPSMFVAATMAQMTGMPIRDKIGTTTRALRSRIITGPMSTVELDATVAGGGAAALNDALAAGLNTDSSAGRLMTRARSG
jgi:hypothetical protein